MVYITAKDPVVRATDTPLGKVIGYLSHALEYLRWESYAGSIDAVLPDWFPINIVQSALIDVCRAVYNSIYQNAYDKGADRGNELNNMVLGWVDDARKQALAKVAEAQAYIQSNLINPIKSQIDNTISPQLRDAMSKVSSLNSSVSNAMTQIDSMTTSIRSFDSSLKSFRTILDGQRLIVNDLKSQTDSIQSFLADIDRRVKALETTQNPLSSIQKILQT